MAKCPESGSAASVTAAEVPTTNGIAHRANTCPDAARYWAMMRPYVPEWHEYGLRLAPVYEGAMLLPIRLPCKRLDSIG